MKLEKKDFTQIKYNELINYASSNNMIIVDKGEYYETEKVEEPVKTFEELKQEKISELKEKRDEYKKTIFIKDKNLLELEDKSKYHFDNLILGLCGYTETDLTEYKTYINNISKIYDDYKLKINNTTTKRELDKIIINF